MLLQLVALVFLTFHISFETDVMINSAHAAGIEVRIGRMIGLPGLMCWQSLVGNIPLHTLRGKKRHADWYQPLLLTIIHVVVYIYCVLQFYRYLSLGNRPALLYVIISVVFGSVAVIDAVRNRNEKLNKVSSAIINTIPDEDIAIKRKVRH
jgi:hypothetical protein